MENPVLNNVKFMSSYLIKKIIRHAQKQDNMTHDEEKNISVENS